MSWWKSAKELQNFEDRNIVNDGIHNLEDLAGYLTYAAELVYMTARGAREMVANVREHKTLSTYPDIKDALSEADRIALDSPKRFATYCQAAAQSILGVISDLEDQRKDYYNKTLPAHAKGFIDYE